MFVVIMSSSSPLLLTGFIIIFSTGFITTGKTDALRKVAGLNSQVCFRQVCYVRAALSTGEHDGDQVRNIKTMYALDLSNSREE